MRVIHDTLILVLLLRSAILAMVYVKEEDKC